MAWGVVCLPCCYATTAPTPRGGLGYSDYELLRLAAGPGGDAQAFWRKNLAAVQSWLGRFRAHMSDIKFVKPQFSLFTKALQEGKMPVRPIWTRFGPKLSS